MRLKLADDETEIDFAALQGLWSVEQYLKLTNQTNRLIEFTDGVIEVLPMPTKSLQAIFRVLFLTLLAVMQRIDGDVFYASSRVEAGPGSFVSRTCSSSWAKMIHARRTSIGPARIW